MAKPNSSVVHVVDDDDAVRDSLMFLLSSAGFAVEGHATPRAFLERAAEGDVGCVITDVRMPEMTGIELLQEVRERHPGVPVIVITGHADIPLAVDAMRKGALDFLEKPFNEESLLSALRAALSRQEHDEQRASERSSIAQRLALVSMRERQVLDGLVAGKPNKLIAHDLGISPRTVEVYRANLMTKMQAGSLSDLVRMALLAGLLDGERTVP